MRYIKFIFLGERGLPGPDGAPGTKGIYGLVAHIFCLILR